MHRVLIIPIVLCCVLFFLFLDILLYEPPVKLEKTEEKKQEEPKDRKKEFGCSISYWKTWLEFVLKAHPDLSTCIEGVAFQKGMLLKDRQNTGKRKTVLFCFHTLEHLNTFLEAYTKLYREVAPSGYDVYCYLSFSHDQEELVQYFQSHHIACHLCIEDTQSLITLSDGMRYMPIGIMRPARYVLEWKGKKQEVMRGNFLIEENLSFLKDSLPRRLYLQLKWKLTRLRGIRNLARLEPVLKQKCMDYVRSNAGTLEFCYASSEGIEKDIQSLFHATETTSVKILSQSVESRNCLKHPIVKKIEQGIQSYGNIRPLYVYRTDSSETERLFDICIAFCPCTDSETVPHYRQIEMYMDLLTKERK